MSVRKLRWLGSGLLVSAAACLLALTAMMNAAFAFGETADAAAADPTIGLVMGGSGQPIPGPETVEGVNTYITSPLSTSVLPFTDTVYPGVLANGLFTPEGLYPLTGVKTLPLNYPLSADGFPAASTSVGQGITILNNNIQANVAAGDATTVGGVSQSATIASLAMQQLDPSGTPSSLPVQFVLIGDPSAPNGGLLERFAGFETLSGQTTSLPLNVASMGVAFDGATPANDFPTAIYSAEYDGFADFPRYPLDFLSDVNAFLGIEDVHCCYPTPPPETAFALPTSGATETTYYMIPTTDLPLLDPLRSIPVIGNPLADLLQPDLTYLVNLGYGDPLYGYSTSAANVATPFGLFPSLSAFEQLPGLLASGTEQGIQNFIDDFTGTGPNPVTHSLSSLTSLVDPLSGTTGALADPSATLSTLASDPATSLTDIVNGISGAASSLYSALLATADIVNALVTSLPAYDISLFLDNLTDPLDAIGLPIAADNAMVTLAAGFEFAVIGSAIAGAINALTP